MTSHTDTTAHATNGNGKRTLHARITQRVNGVIARVVDEYKDTSNLGPDLATCYAYGIIAKVYKRSYESLRDELFQRLPTEAPKFPGTHEVLRTENFSIQVKVSNPVKRFDLKTFADLLQKRHPSVKYAEVRALYEQAKLPTKPLVTREILELVKAEQILPDKS